MLPGAPPHPGLSHADPPAALQSSHLQSASAVCQVPFSTSASDTVETVCCPVGLLPPTYHRLVLQHRCCSPLRLKLASAAAVHVSTGPTQHRPRALGLSHLPVTCSIALCSYAGRSNHWIVGAKTSMLLQYLAEAGSSGSALCTVS